MLFFKSYFYIYKERKLRRCGSNVQIQNSQLQQNKECFFKKLHEISRLLNYSSIYIEDIKHSWTRNYENPSDQAASFLPRGNSFKSLNLNQNLFHAEATSLTRNIAL